MGMSHADCTHPRTPAGRAACRKGGGPAETKPFKFRVEPKGRATPRMIAAARDDAPPPENECPGSRREWAGIESATCPVCHATPKQLGLRDPRWVVGKFIGVVATHDRRDYGTPGVSTGTKRRRSSASVDLKTPGARVRERHDLADIPRSFMPAINYAWINDWPVVVGQSFTDDHRHIEVRSELGVIHLAWSSTNPNGLQRVSWRPMGTSVTKHISTLNGALRLAAGEEE